MEFLNNHEMLSTWLVHYGAFSLFGLLALGIILLPIPDETLLVLAGVLLFEGHLSPFPTILAAILGSMTGMTVSYIIGKTAGKYMIRRFGGWIGLTHERIVQCHDWFKRFGKWTLFFGYFVPGLRHFTGVLAGSTALEYGYFALFAYAGALLWSMLFLSVGYFFGSYWISVIEWIEIDLDEVVIAILLLYIFYLIVRSKRT